MVLTTESLAAHLRSVDDLELPPGDGRTAAVHRRVRRRRRHRLGVGTLAVVIVLAATAGIVMLTRSTVSVAQLAAEHGLATSLRQPDGVIYRIAAVVTMDTGEEQSVTVRVPAPYGIVTVAGTCDSSGYHTPFAPTDINVSAPGVQSETSFLCGPHVGPTDLEVGPPGADGRAALMLTNQDLIRPYAVIWTFGIYTWQLPAKLKPPTPLPDLPSTLDGYSLRQTFAGTLATRRSVTVHIPGKTRWEIVPICGQALQYASSSALQIGQVTISVGGAPRVGQSCAIVASAGDLADLSVGPDLSGVVPPIDGDVTITFEYPQAYDLRAATWALGVYEKT